MSYMEWTQRVGVALASERPDVRLADLDPDALREAYGRGVAPDGFVAQPVLPLRKGTVSPAPQGGPSPRPSGSPVPAAIATRSRWNEAVCPNCHRTFRKPIPLMHAAVGIVSAMALTRVSPAAAPFGFVPAIALAAIPAQFTCPFCGTVSSHNYL